MPIRAGVDVLDVDLPLLEDYAQASSKPALPPASPGAHDQQRALLYRYLQIEGYMGHDPTELLTTPRFCSYPLGSAHARGGGTHSRLHRPLHAREGLRDHSA